jgi:hypothetical protein
LRDLPTRQPAIPAEPAGNDLDQAFQPTVRSDGFHRAKRSELIGRPRPAKYPVINGTDRAKAENRALGRRNWPK